MSKIILISNRLPVTIVKDGKGLSYRKSVGGLATGLKSVYSKSNCLWIGWPGLPENVLDKTEKQQVKGKLLKEYRCLPVFLTEEEVDNYYYGFCNKTIWPLFHYFLSKVEYSSKMWDAYQKANQKFFEMADTVIQDGDTVWVHDYQLMLLPQMIKEKHPNVHVGFFLHIPFPVFEVYRLLIWREKILKGLLGADLIGFHTYDYVRHFLDCVNRLLGTEYNYNVINYRGRHVKVDAFPMGIDYNQFFSAPDSAPSGVDKTAQKSLEELVGAKPKMKMILSVDRLDYTKGIPERILAFSHFLAQYPQYRGKVRLNLIVAPSRAKVDSYASLKKEINQLVGEVNGKFGTLDWMPIWYYYHAFSQEDLISLYRHSDVLLDTPLRDGMNLVCKEYIASRNDYGGMAVISETAGASAELSEAIVVNANDYDTIAAGIKSALEMPIEEKLSRNRMMHAHLKEYDVNFWADKFLLTLGKIKIGADAANGEQTAGEIRTIRDAYRNVKKRLLFLDYDGTLMPFQPTPNKASPDNELRQALSALTNDPKNTVVITSGRDRGTLDKWLSGLNLSFVASHGMYFRRPNGKWLMTMPEVSVDVNWKEPVRHILQLYTYNIPGSLIEEKDVSIAWHYRRCDPHVVAAKYPVIKEALLCLMGQFKNLGLQEGHKVLEVKDKRVNKGIVSSLFIQNADFDFIFGAGDDYTDEDLFLALPQNAFTVKIGPGKTHAHYQLPTWQDMRSLLNAFNSNS
jgi:trehalose 6-phosphate synthase/phosphatase